MFSDRSHREMSIWREIHQGHAQWGKTVSLSFPPLGLNDFSSSFFVPLIELTVLDCTPPVDAVGDISV